ncbi:MULTISPECIES: NADH-dependent flavin oxidoreductase [unclassified Mesorhizobium]|uniref:NADH-dependent flavin oxidoreductase n=1 Tax=unclassified Mesorhizobium TaxID=325217 RepID=UPI003335FEAC
MDTSRQIFQPFQFPNGLSVDNRIVMAPMTTWSANDDGTVSDAEITYYRRRATGVGLVLTGCTHVLPDGIGFAGEFASYDDRFTPSLSRLASAAKSGGAKAVLQIFHAGSKAVPALIPRGDVVSASALEVQPGPFNPGGVKTRALTNDEILAIITAFGEATRRAIEAGFDGIELHGAHGFLIQNFFSPLYNQRGDEWGGTLENRMRFPIAVVREVKRVVAAHANRPFLVGYRVSPEEPESGGLRIADTYELIECLIDEGVDYLHASLTSVLEAKPIEAPEGDTIAGLITRRASGRVPVVAAGQVRTPFQAELALHRGLTLVAVGQGLVMNPEWVELAKSGREDLIETEIRPSSVLGIDIPAKLWGVIQSATGWFKIIAETDVPKANAA